MNYLTLSKICFSQVSIFHLLYEYSDVSSFHGILFPRGGKTKMINQFPWKMSEHFSLKKFFLKISYMSVKYIYIIKSHLFPLQFFSCSSCKFMTLLFNLL